MISNGTTQTSLPSLVFLGKRAAVHRLIKPVFSPPLLSLCEPNHAVIDKYLPVSAMQSYLYAKNVHFTKYRYYITRTMFHSLAVINWSSLNGKNLTDVIGKP